MKFYVVYWYNFPGCNDSYIGKAQRNLCTRTEEHACNDKESAIYNHINNCTYDGYVKNLFRLHNDLFDKTLFSIKSVKSNTRVKDSAHNRNILLIIEVLFIKQKKPKLNGLKASEDFIYLKLC